MLCPSTLGTMDAEGVVDENSQQSHEQSRIAGRAYRRPSPVGQGLMPFSFKRLSLHTWPPCGQGGFQSSWTGRNGGASTGNPSQVVHQVAGTQERAGRRFGTVSNPSAAGGPSARPGRQAVAPGQQEPVLAPGQSSSASLSSQVKSFISMLLS